MAKDRLRLLMGTRKGLFVLERAKKRWKIVEHAYVGIPVPYAMHDSRTGSVWCSLDHGHWGQKVSRARELGAAWEPIEPPKYPEKAEVKPGKPATLRYVWTIAPGHADEPQRVYFGTDPGGLFVTNDDGKNIELVTGLWNHPSRAEHWFGGGRDLPGIHSVLVDARNPRRVLVGISCAGVFETIDGGASWTPRNKGLLATYLPDPNVEVGHDPHIVVACAADPDVLWQQNHCGIFRSKDGAQTWKAIQQTDGPAKFGFAIACDAEDPKTAWVVPAQSDEKRTTIEGALVVMRTEDGGKSWEELRKGLPQEACYDVVYRHALDIRGDALAFGSTTGNVYWSDDRGESWDTIGNNFPPVYSVRFA